MNTAATPIQPSYAERIAWLHQPVHLHCAFVPWFVVRMLEAALHRYFCRFEQVLLAMVDGYNQGMLEPWPEVVEQAPVRPSRLYQMKQSPAARKGDAGRSVVSAASAAATGAAALAAAGAGVAASGQAGMGAVGLVGLGRRLPPLLRPVQQHRGSNAFSPSIDPAGHALWQRPALGGVWRPDGRCRKSMVCQPAVAGWEICVQIVPVC